MTRKAMLKRNLEEIIQNECLDSQSETSPKSAAVACPKACSTEGYGTQLCTNIESKTLIRNRGGQHFPFDESYLNFVDNSLEGRYTSKFTDFKHIESIIAELDQESQVQILKVERIAPFNSNLPVLNISQLKPPVPSISPIIPPKLRKTKSSMLNSNVKMLTKNKDTPSGLSKTCKKHSTRKRKRGCPKQSSSVINGINTSKNNIMSDTANDSFEKEINKSLAAILQSSFESMSSNSDVHIQSPKKPTIETDSNFIHASNNTGGFLKNNIENLLKKNMDNFVAQQQHIQRQFELSTLYLRQQRDLSFCSSCETLLPGIVRFKFDL